MSAGETEGGRRRRSGRRSAQPLQHIGIGGGAADPEPGARHEDDEIVLDVDEVDTPPEGDAPSEPGESPGDPGASDRGETGRTVRVTRTSTRRRLGAGRVGLDRIRPRGGPPTIESAAAEASDPGSTERDPLGRAALYSSGSGREQPLFGTFLVECSACRRETPVTAGDLLRLGIPSLHLLFVKRYPSLMRCPSCGRRTWLRVRWRI